MQLAAVERIDVRLSALVFLRSYEEAPLSTAVKHSFMTNSNQPRWLQVCTESIEALQCTALASEEVANHRPCNHVNSINRRRVFVRAAFQHRLLHLSEAK